MEYDDTFLRYHGSDERFGATSHDLRPAVSLGLDHVLFYSPMFYEPS